LKFDDLGRTDLRAAAYQREASAVMPLRAVDGEPTQNLPSRGAWSGRAAGFGSSSAP